MLGVGWQEPFAAHRVLSGRTARSVTIELMKLTCYRYNELD